MAIQDDIKKMITLVDTYIDINCNKSSNEYYIIQTQNRILKCATNYHNSPEDTSYQIDIEVQKNIQLMNFLLAHDNNKHIQPDREIINTHISNTSKLPPINRPKNKQTTRPTTRPTNY